MTGPELDALLAGFALAAPVSLADAQEIYAELRPRVAAGVSLDVQLRGLDAIEIVLGAASLPLLRGERSGESAGRGLRRTLHAH